MCLFFATVALQVLTIYYRQSKSIRAMSPKVQQMAFLGVYMLELATGGYTLMILGSEEVHFYV